MSCALVISITVFLQGICVSANEISFQHLNAKALLLMDAVTGEVIYSEDEHTVLPVYSVSKLMTAYIVLESIKNGQLKWDQQVVIDAQLDEISRVYAFTNVPLVEGESYTVRDLFQAMLVQSANAATMALAKTISGSEQQFVKIMNTYAKNLELSNSTFVSSSGLEQEDLVDFGIKIAEGGNRMSAIDVATLMRAIFVEYPETADITKQSQMWFNESDEIEKFLMTTSNPLLPGATQEIPGFLGGKSGFGGLDGTAAYAALLHDNERSLITVVIGAMNMNDVYESTRQLMEYGRTLELNNSVLDMQFSELNNKSNNGDMIYDFQVMNGEKDKFTVNFSKIIPEKYQDVEKYTYEFKPINQANFASNKNTYVAPILKEQIIGNIIIKNTDNSVVKTIVVKSEETVAAVELTWIQKVIKFIIEIF